MADKDPTPKQQQAIKNAIIGEGGFRSLMNKASGRDKDSAGAAAFYSEGYRNLQYDPWVEAEMSDALRPITKELEKLDKDQQPDWGVVKAQLKAFIEQYGQPKSLGIKVLAEGPLAKLTEAQNALDGKISGTVLDEAAQAAKSLREPLYGTREQQAQQLVGKIHERLAPDLNAGQREAIARTAKDNPTSWTADRQAFMIAAGQLKEAMKSYASVVYGDKADGLSPEAQREAHTTMGRVLSRHLESVADKWQTYSDNHLKGVPPEMREKMQEQFEQGYLEMKSMQQGMMQDAADKIPDSPEYRRTSADAQPMPSKQQGGMNI